MVAYGYARVSSRDQNLDRQISQLLDQGIKKQNLFLDKASGKDFCRPSYAKLLKKIGPNDSITVTSLDRFGRNYTEIIEQWQLLTKTKQIQIRVLDMPLLNSNNENPDLTQTMIADMVMMVLSYVAELEREKIRIRQAEGIREARKKGKHLGRPTKKTIEWEFVKRGLLKGNYSYNEVAEKLGVSKSTVYRWTKKEQHK